MAETWRKWKWSERPKSLSESSFLKQLQRPSSRRRSQHAANPCRRTALSATPATPATPAQPATALPSHKYSSRGRRRRRWWGGGGAVGVTICCLSAEATVAEVEEEGIVRGLTRNGGCRDPSPPLWLLPFTGAGCPFTEAGMAGQCPWCSPNCEGHTESQKAQILKRSEYSDLAE